MSIASAIANKQQQVANCYTAISNKGGTLPATQDVANMPTAINSISTGGTIDSLTITPTTSQQTITASGGTGGFSPITVNAVTSAIDANIQASNIKSGVSILSVAGNVVELNGETRTEQLDSTSGNTYTPTMGKNAITSITVTPKNYARTVAPQTTQSVWAVPSGYSGHGNITVSPVTSAIDANITAGNIKSGVSILGVNGNVVELNGETRTVSLTGFGQTFTPTTGKNAITSITVNPSNLARTVNPSTTSQSIGVQSGFSGNGTITVNPVTASIDANITAGNIKSGITILGVTGNYGGGGSKYGATIDNLLGDVDANGVLQLPTAPSGDLVFTGVKDLANYALYYRFNYTNINRGVEFTDLEEVSGANSLYYAFANNLISSISLQKLKTVSGANGMYGAFASNSSPSMTSVSLPELETVSGNSGIRSLFQSNGYLISLALSKLKTVTGQHGLYQLCASCSALTSLDLEALETISSTASTALGYLLQMTPIVVMRFTKLSEVSAATVFIGSFQGCKNITDIYFNALTTTSFGSNINQFNNMFNSGSNGTAATSGNVNVHFPSNLQSTIAGLTGYPNFGATAGRVTLLFDLAATS